jgi:hypothetical protein
MTGFGPGLSETDARSFGKCATEPERHFVPELPSQDRKKGQPEGYAVTGKTGKPWVAENGLVSNEAADHNNSNLTPRTTSVVNGGWELILTNSSHSPFAAEAAYGVGLLLFRPAAFSRLLGIPATLGLQVLPVTA